MQSCLPESTGALGVRVLARVLGSDLARLVDRISAASKVRADADDARAVALHFEAEFAAGVLASLALDPAVAGRVVSTDSGFLGRIVAFLQLEPAMLEFATWVERSSPYRQAP